MVIGLFSALLSSWLLHADVAKEIFVPVGGYGSRLDLPERYFAPVNEEFQKRGLLYLKAERPKARLDALTNSEILYQKYFGENSPYVEHPLHFVGHSYGGVILVRMVLEHPEVLESSRLGRITTVQSPLLGSKLSDPLDMAESLAEFYLPMGGTIVESFRSWTNSIIGGSRSMGTRQSRSDLSRLLGRLTEKQKRLFSEKLIQVTASTEVESLPLAFRSTGRLLERLDGPNDGVVSEISMAIPGVGIVEKIFSDHGSPVMTLPGFSRGDTTSVLDLVNILQKYPSGRNCGLRVRGS